MTTPFRFSTAADHASTGDLSEAMKYALTHPDPDVRNQLLAGIATRTDLTAKHFTQIAEARSHDSWAILVALLNNPRLRDYPKVFANIRRSIGPDGFYALLDGLDDPHMFLPDMLSCAHNHSQFPDRPAYLAEQFSPDLINQAMDGLVTDYLTTLNDPHSRASIRFHSATAQSPFLTPTHLTTILIVIHDSLTAAQTDEDAFAALSATFEPAEALAQIATRDDLSIDQAHLAYNSIEMLFDIEQACTSQTGRTFIHTRATQILSNSNLPTQVLARAVIDPTFFESIISANARRTAFTDEVLIEAIRQGAPITVLADRPALHRIPADVLDLALSQLEDSPPTATTVSLLRMLVPAATNTIGTPRWDRLYNLWVSTVTTEVHEDGTTSDPQTQFADLVERRAITWVDRSITPTLHHFAVWASRSDDPNLRRHAVKHIWSPEQNLAAATDPSPLVRAACLDHEYVREDVLIALTYDPEQNIRLAVASHRDATADSLHHFISDADATVRLAAVNNDAVSIDTLEALVEDSDPAVQATVADKFLKTFV